MYTKQQLSRMSLKERLEKVYMYDSASHYKDLSHERAVQTRFETMLLDKQTQDEIKPTEPMNMLVDYFKDRLTANQYCSVPRPLLDVCKEPRCMNPPMAVSELLDATRRADALPKPDLENLQFFRIIDPRPESKFAVNVGHVPTPSENVE